jgi:hypothetical protein
MQDVATRGAYMGEVLARQPKGLPPIEELLIDRAKQPTREQSRDELRASFRRWKNRNKRIFKEGRAQKEPA